MAGHQQSTLHEDEMVTGSSTPRRFIYSLGGRQSDQELLSHDHSSITSSVGGIHPSSLPETHNRNRRQQLDVDLNFNDENDNTNNGNSIRNQIEQEERDMRENGEIQGENDGGENDEEALIANRRQWNINEGDEEEREPINRNEDLINRMKSYCKKKWKYSVFIAMFVVIFSTGGSLIVVTVLPSFASITTNILVNEDSVLIDINTNGVLSTMFVLCTVKITHSADINIVIDIHSVPKDKIQLKYSPFNNDILRRGTDRAIMDSSHKYYFKNCSNFTALCPIDEYIYQVKEENSIILYNITVDPFVQGQTIVRFVGFDSDKMFDDFLDGYGIREAIVSQEMSSKSVIFWLDPSKMKKLASYYFFALEEVRSDPNHAPETYMVSRGGTHVTFTGLENHTPLCNITTNNSCEFPLSLNYRYITKLRGHNSATTLNNITIQNYLRPSPTGHVLFIVGCVMVALPIAIMFVALFSFWCYRCCQYIIS